MLKFLDNRTGEVIRKSPKKYKPEMLYGISIQAPSQFQTPYTIVKKDTYINPYFKFEEKRKESVRSQKQQMFQPKWRHKINLNMVQEQKIISSVPDLIPNTKEKLSSRYTHAYHDQLNKSKRRFNMTRGQFTDFIDRNHHYRPIGPLHGVQRTEDRINNTKESVWLSSTKSKQNASFLNNSIGSSMKRSASTMTKNSDLITQKSRIRFNRENFNSRLKNVLDERKKSSNIHMIELPRLGSELISIHKHQVSILGRDQPKEDQNVKELNFLETFTDNLARKFK